MKRFTRKEAEALIPALEAIFESVAELAARAEVKAQALHERRERGAEDPVADAIERSALQLLAKAINDKLQEIVDLGALPKGVAPALVDFPSVVEGREAYLCWKLGEKSLAYWHGADEGFSSRKRLR